MSEPVYSHIVTSGLNSYFVTQLQFMAWMAAIKGMDRKTRNQKESEMVREWNLQPMKPGDYARNLDARSRARKKLAEN